MIKKVEFPIYFNQCPNCGCPDTITRLACEEEKKKGTIGKDAFVAMGRMQNPLIDPRHPPAFSARVLVASFDICAKCGTQYCTKAEIATAPVTTSKMPGMKQFGFPQGPPGVS